MLHKDTLYNQSPNFLSKKMQALGSTQVVAPYAPLEQDHQKFWVQVLYILLQLRSKYLVQTQ